MRRLYAALPVSQWLARYDRAWLRADVLAGVSSWALIVPQAVAYSQIAGLPAQAGLAASFAGPLGYALLGTSRQLMVSPTSSTAAISAALVAPLAQGDVHRFVAISAALALLTGVVFVLLGVWRLGFVSQFLSTSVQVGFMFGLGATIAVGQLFKLLGIPPPAAGSDFIPSVWALITRVSQTNPWTAVVGLGGLATLLILKRCAPLAPAALIVAGGGIVATTLLGLADHGVATVGAIPRGLPLPVIPDVQVSDILPLVPVSFALAVIGYAESASVAQEFATHHHYDVDSNQELIAVGGANVLTGLFQGFIVAGGASQSAANDRAGARTQLACMIVAGLALVTAVALTPLFFNLPEAILAAVVINAVLGFFRAAELRRIRAIRRDSFALALFAMFGVLLLGMLSGLLLAVFLSIVLLLGRVSRPSVERLGRAPDIAAYGDLRDGSAFQAVPGLTIIRPDAPLLFANARWVRSHTLDLVRQETPRARVVLLDLEMSFGLDVESVDTLAELRATLQREGSELWLGAVHLRARQVLERGGYIDHAPRSVYIGLEPAVDAFTSQHSASAYHD